MADIENLNNRTALLAKLRDMSNDQLTGQELVQQGGIHAVSFLLTHGCTEAHAVQMLDSLREFSAVIREEFARRGIERLFSIDQLEVKGVPQ